MQPGSKKNARVREHAGGEVRRDAASAFVSQGHNSSPPSGCQQTYNRRLDAPAHGRVSGDVWQKAVRRSVHQLRAPRAWAVDVVDLDAAERLGVRYVQLRDLEQMREYWAGVKTIRARGWTFDRGFGEQMALAAEHWRPTRAKAVELARELAESEPPALQADLWKGGAR
jgi:hypothetical protein